MDQFLVIGCMHRLEEEPILLLSFDQTHPWGAQGIDYDPDYFVTTEPVYLQRPGIGDKV